MTSPLPTTLRQLAAGTRALLVLTVLLGLAYPLLMTGAAQLLFHDNADGSMVTARGRPVGSDLIGQAFTVPGTGRPDPAYFQSRPSAAGTGYDPLATGASNLALDNRVLVEAVRRRQAAAAALDGVARNRVAPDAVLASGSGLDPQISPQYAAEQVARVARVRHLPRAQVRALVDRSTQGRTLGFLGEPRVNVLLLNLALDALPGQRGAH
jgi:K+-transporting ATPase ATPase C chain